MSVLTAIAMGTNFCRTGNIFKFTKSPVPVSDSERKAEEAKKAYLAAMAADQAQEKDVLDARFKYVEAEKKRKREADSEALRYRKRVKRTGGATKRALFADVPDIVTAP